MSLSLPLETVDRAVGDPASSRLSAFLDQREPELVRFRRDMHAHPELGRQETRTTGRIVEQLEAAGLAPKTLPHGSGVICDIGPDYASSGARLAIRADIDALPIQEADELPFRSRVEGVSHACGHDVHTTAALGAGLFLAEEARAGRLARGVR